MNWRKTLITCLLILGAGAILMVLIFTTEPTASKSGATKQTAMLVNVVDAEQGSFRPVIKAMGVVEPSQDIVLSPRVNGEIIEIANSFAPGGFVQKGEELLKMDPSDYEIALTQAQSELHQAEADLRIEMGQQEVARREYELLEDTLSEENRALLLRQPQLNTARAQVEAARAAVQQAKQDLERTTIRAPFDAYIMNRNVNVGSNVAAGADLGRLVDRDVYWVEASIPLSHLRWLDIPKDDNTTGTEVRMRNRSAWPEGEYRTGYLYRLVGSLETQTRMAQVLINVPDPLSYLQENADKPSLMIGAFVEVSIPAKELEQVVRLNRDYIRQDDRVWVMAGDSLQIRDVNIEFRDSRYAYISGGLSTGDQVVITNLSTVTEGAPLRLSEPGDMNSNSSSGQPSAN